MVLKIYADYMSQPARAVILFCLEAGVSHQVEVVQIAKGHTRTPQYKKINPMGQVPAIDDDGFVLNESNAILPYLASSRQVADHWYPRDLKRRARIDSLLHWHHSNLRFGSSTLAFNKVIGPRMGLPSDPALIKRAEDTLSRALKIMNDVFLAQSDFVAGSEISIADIAFACELVTVFLLQYPLEQYPNVAAWLKRVQGLKHWNEVHTVFNKVLSATLKHASDSKTNPGKTIAASQTSGSVAKSSSPLRSAVVFDEIQKRLPEDGPEMVKQLNCVFKFQVSGKDAKGAAVTTTWTADLKNGTGSVSEGENKLAADTTFILSDDDFLSLAAGKLNPQMAFMNGKMKIKGNLAKALKFDAVVLKKRGKEIREVLATLPTAKL